MHGSTFTLPAVKNLLQRCRKLRILELSFAALSAEVLHVMAECDTPMEKLYLNPALLGEVARYERLFSRLQEATLGVNFLLSPTAVPAISFMEHLRTLTAVGSPQDQRASLVNAVQVVAQHSPLLESLTCAGCVSLDAAFAAALCAVVVNCPRLVKVSICSDMQSVSLPEDLLACLLQHKACTCGRSKSPTIR